MIKTWLSLLLLSGCSSYVLKKDSDADALKFYSHGFYVGCMTAKVESGPVTEDKITEYSRYCDPEKRIQK